MTLGAVTPSWLEWRFPGGAHVPDDGEARPMEALNLTSRPLLAKSRREVSFASEVMTLEICRRGLPTGLASPVGLPTGLADPRPPPGFTTASTEPFDHPVGDANGLVVSGLLEMFTDCLRFFPALNLGRLAAGIWMRSPVRGLRPTEAFLSTTLNVPKPTSLTSFPRRSAPVTESNTPSTAFAASALERPEFEATAATRSFLFTCYPHFWILFAENIGLSPMQHGNVSRAACGRQRKRTGYHSMGNWAVNLMSALGQKRT